MLSRDDRILCLNCHMRENCYGPMYAEQKTGIISIQEQLCDLQKETR